MDLNEIQQLIKNYEQQLKEKDQKLKEKDEDSKNGYFLDRGLPALMRGSFSTTKSKASIAKKRPLNLVGFSVVKENVDVPVFNKDELELRARPSKIWAKDMTWYNEADIKSFVENVYEDSLAATGASEVLTVKCERLMDYSSLEKTDLVIQRKKATNFLIVGPTEIKKPPNSKQKSESESRKGYNMDDVSQIVSYMFDLKSNCGVRFVFGVITTYQSWRFVWFEEDDSAMMSDSLEAFKGLCYESPPNSPTTETSPPPSPTGLSNSKLRVVTSRVYEFDDVLLVPTLCTLHKKMCYIPSDPINFLQKNRIFLKVRTSSNDCSYGHLPKELKKFTYQFPPGTNTDIYYILSSYRRSGDGKVCLLCSNKGNISVAKLMEDREKLAHEVILWKAIWNVNILGGTLAGLEAILMPFAFHFYLYPNEPKIVCRSFKVWNHRDPAIALFDPDTVLEDSLFDNADLVKDPLLVAETALRKMIKRGYKQQDEEVRWEHIGLLPTFKNDQCWTLTPIMFDLSRVTPIADHEDKDAIFLQHFSTLKSQLE